MSWIFSKAMMQDYASLHFLQGQAVEYSGANCSDGEPFAQLNVMPTQHKFWRNDKPMEFSNLSRFGLTLRLLTEQDGEALLTSYLAGFHAKTYPQQEKAQELKASEAECGKKWHGLLAKYDPLTHSWKTAQCSLLEDLEQSLQTWPRSGSMRNGACYQRQMLVQTMSAKESGFWPTPTCNMVSGGPNHNSPQVIAGKHGINLHGAVLKAMKFPTPQASDNRDRGNLSSPSVQRRKEIGKQISLSQSVSEVSGKLNPTWVEWLMGWPLEWTDLKPLEMGKSPCVQQQHLNCLETDLSEAA